MVEFSQAAPLPNFYHSPYFQNLNVCQKSVHFDGFLFVLLDVRLSFWLAVFKVQKTVKFEGGSASLGCLYIKLLEREGYILLFHISLILAISK